MQQCSIDLKYWITLSNHPYFSCTPEKLILSMSENLYILTFHFLVKTENMALLLTYNYEDSHEKKPAAGQILLCPDRETQYKTFKTMFPTCVSPSLPLSLCLSLISKEHGLLQHSVAFYCMGFLRTLLRSTCCSLYCNINQHLHPRFPLKAHYSAFHHQKTGMFTVSHYGWMRLFASRPTCFSTGNIKP